MVTTPDRFCGRDAIAVMSGPDVEYFALQLPEGVLKSGDEKLHQIVGAEVARLMGSDGNGVVSHFWRSPAGKPLSPNVVGIGATPDKVRALLASIDDARLSCLVVEPAALALSRLGSLLCNPGENELWGLLDLGARQARLVLCLGNAPVLGRPVGSGVDDWVRRVSEMLEVSEKSAVVHLREHGVAAPGGRDAGERHARRDSLAGLITGALRCPLRSMISEMQRSVSYAKQCYPDRDFRRLVAVGRGSVVPNVSSYLRYALGLEVRRASDFLCDDRCRLSCSTACVQPLELIALAVGAVLST